MVVWYLQVTLDSEYADEGGGGGGMKVLDIGG